MKMAKKKFVHFDHAVKTKNIQFKPLILLVERIKKKRVAKKNQQKSYTHYYQSIDSFNAKKNVFFSI